ncbi:PTS system mannose/fructose/N-acetylgalactosamine-transporter subunit IIB [Providencia manganoxydans]|uniref:PTS sugar transporter subunit IIB n=2 Tax=Providencia TaxID=586 RepID=A0A1S1HQ61_PROST|nr:MULTISPECIES: PTS sugar transporter subunit IIB [Providencia]ELR5038201.1 PTS sugar transporter subunit IIB [Providencia stuartii]ELR5081114.1 PTS sugar transporter subunit IIB [Providencia stuartii]ELR5113349.1 PTS sugar transporter subunit IIB [Providencia stuartii]MDX4946184.1 PTS sugar transporter subunit IIB [Providencia manganoxydans]OHT23443.1 PTS sugar transporter subunit IIC [Providencia stuartii]
MKGIVHIRVDDRLIHGQVATRWVSHFNANRIMIIDDAVAANDIEKMMLRSAAPDGCNTSILARETAFNNISQGNYENQKVLILVKTPEIALQMLNSGLAVKQLNIGNMSNKDDRKQIKRSVSISDSELEIIRELLERGVSVTAQMTPEEPDTDISTFLKGM